jgi:hypothetical protein
MKKITLAILIAVFAISGNIAIAQKRMPENTKKGYRAERKEMQKYLKENVFPVFKIQRADLDKQISAEDKTRIEELRTEMKAHRNLMREKRNAMQEIQEKPTVEQRQEMREMRNTMHNLMNEADMLSEKYYDEIYAAMQPIKENAKTWRQDMMEMRGDKERPEHPQARGEQGKKPIRNHKPGHHQNPMERLMDPVHFLLWDADGAAQFFEDDIKTNQDFNVNLFPNPASTSVQVSADLNEDQTLEISILNREGQEILNSGTIKASAGVYSKEFNLTELENGIYFVKVNAGPINSVQRLIIQK